MNNITGLLEGIKDIGVDSWVALQSIGRFLNYIMHPSSIISALWQFTLAYAFWICLFVALLSAVFTVFGFKKCFKYIPFSMSIYTLIRMIGSAF